VQLHALATRVLFDADKRAIGVEYLSGERLYRAHPRPSTAPGQLRQVFAAREVILAGGTFNTPQLLMLSGIGPKAELDRHDITVRVDLEGVGKHLQDRYEVSVMNRMNFATWKPLEGATYTSNDPQYKDWSEYDDTVYNSNGAILSVIARSGPGAFSPDLFLYAILGRFEGYAQGYSSLPGKNPNCLSWVVLKAHTVNTAGEVTLRSGDARDRPIINFRYFDESNDANGDDLRAVVAGIRLARKLAAPLKQEGLIAREEVPGDEVGDAELADWVKKQAWGHHASGTCRIGQQEDGGVVSSDFRVHGVEGLRIVDASVFPRIPGYFIVSAVYMIGEKAADVIAAAAAGGRRLGPVRPF
jgi:choline dehydrogenase-like flavoprotein